MEGTPETPKEPARLSRNSRGSLHICHSSKDLIAVQIEPEALENSWHMANAIAAALKHLDFVV